MGLGGDARPGFDQQPIEVSALADAAARAWALTGDLGWVACVEACVAWFAGDNDTGVELYDPVTGGGYDGLEWAGRNANQGAESTLAGDGDAPARLAAPNRQRMIPSPRVSEVVTRTEVRLGADPSRVITKLFIPGEDLPADSSRVNPLVQRVLAMDPDQIDALLHDVLARFEGRHPDLPGVLEEHFCQVHGRLGARPDLSVTQRALLGAYFTAEYSVEGAALCNPSMVAHPDQSGLGPGETRFVLSLRAVGEGHVSSIEFRTGVIGARGHLRLDAPSGRLQQGQVHASMHDKDRVATQLMAAGGGAEIVDLILEPLPASFTGGELEAVLGSLNAQVLTRRVARAHDRYHPIDRGRQLHRGVSCRQQARRTRPVSPRADRVSRHGRRPLRPVQPRRRRHHLLRHLHRVRRRSDRTPAPADRRLCHLPGVAAERSSGDEQGPGPLPPHRRRPLCRPVPRGRRAQRPHDVGGSLVLGAAGHDPGS